MSEQVKLQHKHIDAAECPRCGSTNISYSGGDPDGEPEGSVFCQQCAQIYEVVREYGVKYVYWTDDEGEHTIYDTYHLVKTAAQDLLNAAKDARYCLETPGDFTDHERACVIEDLNYAIGKAEGRASAEAEPPSEQPVLERMVVLKSDLVGLLNLLCTTEVGRAVEVLRGLTRNCPVIAVDEREWDIMRQTICRPRCGEEGASDE